MLSFLPLALKFCKVGLLELLDQCIRRISKLVGDLVRRSLADPFS
jgi:hypothetical protein